MEALTDREFWDGQLHGVSVRHVLPRPARRQRDYAVADLLDRHLRGLRGGRVLELGCGGSVWLPHLARHCGMKAAGVDFSAVGLEKARRILQANGVEAELIEADILTLHQRGLPPYDALFSLGFLEHFTDPRAVLESAIRLLRSGGVLLSWIPSCECVQFELNARWNPHLRGRHYLTDLAGWARYHTEAGFDVLEASYVQWLDFSMLTFPWLPAIGRRAAYMLLATAGLPVIWLGRFLNLRVQSRRLCMGLLLAARKR